MQEQKQEYMRRALALAQRGDRSRQPESDGRLRHRQGRKIIGEGWHEHIGGLHAERNAFAHCTEGLHGRRPLRHARAVLPLGTHAAVHRRSHRAQDRPRVRWLPRPEPAGSRQGAQILRDAGIEVETGVCGDECRRVNEVFFHYITHKTAVCDAQVRDDAGRQNRRAHR